MDPPALRARIRRHAVDSNRGEGGCGHPLGCGETDGDDAWSSRGAARGDPSAQFEEKIEALATRGRYVVAEIDGRTVGHAFLEPAGDLAAISHVFFLTIVVHPGMLGQGIGSTLLRDLLGWARQDSRLTKIELRVRATNTRAMALYQKLGFFEEGRFRRRLRLEDGTFIDDVAMAWFPGREDGAG